MLCRISAVLTVAAVPTSAYRRTSWQDLAANPMYSFEDYCTEFEKHYDSDEERTRRAAVFAKNIAKIRAHNAQKDASWHMGLNRFVDWEDDEMGCMKGVHKGLLHAAPPPHGALTKNDISALPTSKDWRDEKVVTPVKDQGACGSCWAHSVTEGVESAAAIASGKLEVLSVEQLISCAPAPDECGGTSGCNGLNTWLGYKYVAGSKGLTTNKNWPYTAKAQSCDTAKGEGSAVVKVTNYTRVPANDYNALLTAVATIGPISISLDASWTFYEDGVFDGKCGMPDEVNIDHSVQLVGYGTDKKSKKDYWLVRNSWGGSWGEEGYIRMQRYGEGKEPCGVDNQNKTGHRHLCKSDPRVSFPTCGTCGIMCDAAYPTGASHL